MTYTWAALAVPYESYGMTDILQTLKPLRKFSHDDQNADEPIGINKIKQKISKEKG